MAVTTRIFTSDSTGNRGIELREVVIDEITWRLNGIHSAKVSAHPLAADASLIKLNEMELTIILGEGFNDIFQGVPRAVDGNLERLTWEVEHISSYLVDAYILDTDKTYNNVEQMNIQTQLVTYAQAATYANRNILIGTYSPSGIARVRNYLAEEYHNIWEVITKFPELEDGFDWDVVTASDGSRRWTPYYPRKGSQKDQYPMWLDTAGMSEWMRGLTKFRIDGYNQNTDVIVTGPTIKDGAGADTGVKMRGRWTADATTLTKYGRKQVVVSENSTDVTQAWLDDLANSIGASSINPIVVPTIAVSDELFGKLYHGDSFPLHVNYGAIQIAGDFRITEMTLKPPEGIIEIPLQVV